MHVRAVVSDTDEFFGASVAVLFSFLNFSCYFIIISGDFFELFHP